MPHGAAKREKQMEATKVAAHTPGPWRVLRAGAVHWGLYDPTGALVAKTGGGESALYAVADRLNAHDDLLAVIRKARAALGPIADDERSEGRSGLASATIDAIDAAIAKAQQS
jgi:hypothetical protein